MARRSEEELLALVYRRSAEIRRRRRIARVTAAAVTLALVGAVPFVLPGSRERAAEQASSARVSVTTATPTTAPTPTACVCAAPPAAKRHLRATLAQEVKRGAFVSEGVGAVTPFAFASDRSGNWDIYSMDVNGAHLRRLTSDPAIERDPAWSPDGRRLAFVRLAKLTDLVGDIYTMDTDGTHVRHVAVGARPQWSPDGRRLVFFDYAAGKSGGSTGRIWTVRSDGTDAKQVTSLGADAVWTRDGAHIVYGGLNGAASNVAIIGVDGQGQRVLTNSAVYAGQPAVAVDGRIAYIALSGTTYTLNTMDAQGAHQTQITQPADFDVRPSWSPDGSIIAVERGGRSDRQSAPFGVAVDGGGRSRIVFVASDGSNERVLDGGDYDDADPAFPAGAT